MTIRVGAPDSSRRAEAARRRWTRRGLLGGIAAGTVGAVAGCLSDAGSGEADVIAGPDGRLEFDPAELVVEPGATVRWFFDSSGHNVSGRPADSEEVRLPEGAEPFASYGPEASPRSLVPRGETFDHTFDVPGTHTYVCIPHLGAGMIGRVVVEN